MKQDKQKVAPVVPTKNGPAPKSQGGDADLSGAGNVDKIRDILFGTQMRDYEKRFVRLEERLLKESADLRDETRKRFDTLEVYLKKELESLSARVIAEKTARSEDTQELSHGLKELTRALERRAAQIEESATRNHSDLLQQLLAQSTSLHDEIKAKHDEVNKALAREAAELRDEKTDRSALAALFTEAALRLTDDFKLPGE